MPVTLRRRLQCHYCGKRLNTVKREGDKIHCDSCSADNYFDEDNNIIDVPASATADAAGASFLPEVESESDIFCKTCLQNQAFYVRALADYLPDDDDPRYDELEYALPDYKRELDLRYPRCCAQCEPRVQAQIQQADYNAKSDHLRRLLHRKHGRRRSPELALRSWLISAAGFGHATSLALQLSWHGLSSQATTDNAILGLSPQQCLKRWPVPVECTEYLASLVPLALFVALLCIWWNPMWQHRLMGKDGRLTGLRKYYMAQVAILTIRFLAWVILADLPALQQYSHSLHTLAFTLLAMISAYSWLGIITIDMSPLVDWHEVSRPLVDPNQFQPPTQSDESWAPIQPPRFSIANLAGPTRSQYEYWRPPTPPTSGESMDWTPTTESFNPQPRMPKPKFNQPSPFHGNLPAVPMRGTLNPQRPAPPQQKQALGLPPGFFGLSKSKNDQQHGADTQPERNIFAPAKFFAQEREADTGLENIFDKMFSVKDSLDMPGHSRPTVSTSHPTSGIFGHQTSAPSRRRRSSPIRSQQPVLSLVISVAIIVGLAIVASSLFSLELAYGDVTAAPSTILPYTAVIPLVHLFEEMMYAGNVSALALARTILQACIAAVAFALLPTNGSIWIPIWNKLVIGCICFLLLQEIYHFCQLQSTPVSQAVAAHMAQSMERAEQRAPFETHETLAGSHLSPQQPRLNGQPPLGSSLQPTNLPSNYNMPTQIERGGPNSIFNDYSTVRKRDSDESISSVSSIQTTSTAPGWKTPKNDSRAFDWRDNNVNGSKSTPRRPSTNISRGLGGLNLSNDFGSGTSIAGPRSTRQNGGGALGRYRQ